jgi:hypothetical protein
MSLATALRGAGGRYRQHHTNRSSTGTVGPGFCNLLMTAILPGTQPGTLKV